MDRYTVRRLSDDKILFQGIAQRVSISGLQVWIDEDDDQSHVIVVSLANTTLETYEINPSEQKALI